MGYSPWGCKELDRTTVTAHMHAYMSVCTCECIYRQQLLYIKTPGIIAIFSSDVIIVFSLRHVLIHYLLLYERSLTF